MLHRRAFTLIELLVVISIIVLLIALLLPALTAAKDNAKTVMCRSNLYQMVMAYTMYATDEDGFYPMITPIFQHWYPPNVTTWQNQSSRATVGWGDAVGHGLLYKEGYFNNWLAVRCPGRDYEDWPAEDIDNFLDPPSWPFDGPAVDPANGTEYPGRTCYQMRGWEQTAADWRTPDERQAINGDMINGYSTAINPHETGVNVGYSDASVAYISIDTPFNYARTFKEQLLLWAPLPHIPIGVLPHLEAYKFFDGQ